VLFVPTCDLDFWNLKGAAKERSGSCYYAGKMKDIFGRAPEDIPADSVEILRSQHMSREQVRQLFWKSEVFYCYEDTALAIEAQLCGCPTVFVPNEYFSGIPLASRELGTDGSCIAGDPYGLDRATLSVGNFGNTVRSSMSLVPTSIAELAAKWKEMAVREDYQGPIAYPLRPKLVFFEFSELGASADDFAFDEPDPQHTFGFFRKLWLLVQNTYQTGGVRGVAIRIFFAIRRHGFRGVLRIMLPRDAREKRT